MGTPAAWVVPRGGGSLQRSPKLRDSRWLDVLCWSGEIALTDRGLAPQGPAWVARQRRHRGGRDRGAGTARAVATTTAAVSTRRVADASVAAPSWIRADAEALRRDGIARTERPGAALFTATTWRDGPLQTIPPWPRCNGCGWVSDVGWSGRRCRRLAVPSRPTGQRGHLGRPWPPGGLDTCAPRHGRRSFMANPSRRLAVVVTQVSTDQPAAKEARKPDLTQSTRTI